MDILQLCGSFFPSEDLIASHLEYLKFILLGISVMNVSLSIRESLPAPGSLITGIRATSGSVTRTPVFQARFSPFACCPPPFRPPLSPGAPSHFRARESGTWSSGPAPTSHSPGQSCGLAAAALSQSAFLETDLHADLCIYS